MLPRNGLYVVAFGDSRRVVALELGLEALVPVLRQRSCVAVTETTALRGLFLRDRWRAVSATGSWCRPRLKHLEGSQRHRRAGLAHRSEHRHQRLPRPPDAVKRRARLRRRSRRGGGTRGSGDSGGPPTGGGGAISACPRTCGQPCHPIAGFPPYMCRHLCRSQVGLPAEYNSRFRVSGG